MADQQAHQQVFRHNQRIVAHQQAAAHQNTLAAMQRKMTDHIAR
jgi:hypothetical protein